MCFFAKTTHFNGCFVFFIFKFGVRMGCSKFTRIKYVKNFTLSHRITNDVAVRLMKRNREKINRNIHQIDVGEIEKKKMQISDAQNTSA